MFARYIDLALPPRARQSSESICSFVLLLARTNECRVESRAYVRLELALCAWLMPPRFYRIKFSHKKSFLSFKSQE